jgi:hypothetical protein
VAEGDILEPVNEERCGLERRIRVQNNFQLSAVDIYNGQELLCEDYHGRR